MPQAETIRLSFYNSKHPITKTRWIKSVLPVWHYRATPATRSFTLFWGGEGKRKKTFAKPLLPLDNHLEIWHTIGNQCIRDAKGDDGEK